MQKQTQLNVWYAVLAILGILWAQSLWVQYRTVEPITYSEFQEFLKQGKIAEVNILPDYVEGTFKEPQ
ncbi:MAG: ATP-dependent metallopeptidase FtsH/Yme1/Tma family protein, partial [Burkholderiales bacterium]